MPPLKFRAWHPDGLEERLGFKMTYWEMGSGLDNSAFFKHPKTVVMQSTGLLDKNGKEIFEGDILRSKGTRASLVEWSHTVSDSVDYDILTPCFAAHYPPELPYVPSHSWSPLGQMDEIEVIGNIYQDSHLLGQK